MSDRAWQVWMIVIGIVLGMAFPTVLPSMIVWFIKVTGP